MFRMPDPSLDPSGSADVCIAIGCCGGGDKRLAAPFEAVQTMS